MVHDVAKLGFGKEAVVYERSRPSYPPNAVAWLVDRLKLRPGAVALDLAAGTGKLTRLLLPTGASVIAVEPVLGMRQVLHELLPRVPVVAGTAECVPIKASAVDAICVAQAFHWFDADRALAEIERVVRPGGGLGLVWNARDRSVDWVDQVWAVMDEVEKRAPWRDHENWRDHAFCDRPGFGPLHDATFHHDQVTTPAGVVERMRGVSHIAVLGRQEQAEVLGRVHAVLSEHPDTRGRRELRIPYRVDCYWIERT